MNPVNHIPDDVVSVRSGYREPGPDEKRRISPVEPSETGRVRISCCPEPRNATKHRTTRYLVGLYATIRSRCQEGCLAAFFLYRPFHETRDRSSLGNTTCLSGLEERDTKVKYCTRLLYLPVPRQVLCPAFCIWSCQPIFTEINSYRQ